MAPTTKANDASAGLSNLVFFPSQKAFSRNLPNVVGALFLFVIVFTYWAWSRMDDDDGFSSVKTKARGSHLVVGGNNSMSDVKEEPLYLTNVLGPWTGLANNIISIQTAMFFAQRYHRTFIIPPLDNWDHLQGSWSYHSGDPDPQPKLNRQCVGINWDSDAFTDPYRRFSKYFKFATQSVATMDMADLNPSSKSKSNMSISSPFRNTSMYCWKDPPYDREYPRDREISYPPKVWEKEEVACIGVPFEIILPRPVDRPKIVLSEWVAGQAKILLNLHNVSEAEPYLAIHLRRGNWDAYTTMGRFARSTVGKGSLKDEPIERRAAPDEYVLKAGGVLRRALAKKHNIEEGKFQVVVTTNEQNTTSLKRFADAGWVVLKQRLGGDIPEFAQTAVDMAVLVGGAGFLGQYASTFSLIALHMRGCDTEMPSWDCGKYFGDVDLLDIT